MAKKTKLEHPSKENAKSAAETFRILFLDCAENIDMLTDACVDDGYVVVGATEIKDAWAFLHGENHADVIVCAAHLEDESMFDFLRGVRESKGHKDAVFLILSLEESALGVRLQPSTRSASLALGADAFLVMPVFDAPELIRQIRALQPRVPMLLQDGSKEAADQIADEVERKRNKRS